MAITATPTETTAVPTETAAAAQASASKLPDLEVLNVNTGQTVNLASLDGGDKPILFWAWAPH